MMPDLENMEIILDDSLGRKVVELEKSVDELRKNAEESRTEYEALKNSNKLAFDTIRDLVIKLEKDLTAELRSQNPECKNTAILDDLKIQTDDLITKHSLLSKKVDHLEEELQELRELREPDAGDEEELQEPEHHECSCSGCGKCSGSSEEVRDLFAHMIAFNDILIQRLVAEHQNYTDEMKRRLDLQHQNHIKRSLQLFAGVDE